MTPSEPSGEPLPSGTDGPRTPRSRAGARREFRRAAGAPPLVLGHRGARARAPENTFAAFDLAMDEGADGVELDVRMTSDGALVIAHDDELHLASGRTVQVSKLSSAQLASLPESEHPPIPTLAAVLDWAAARAALLNVELKGDVPQPAWLARKAVRLLEPLETSGILVSSFDPRQVAIVARRRIVPVGLLIHSGQSIARRLLDLSPLTYRALGALAVHPERTLITESLMASLARDGALVNTWTVNDPDEAVRLADLGVDALITDRPREILAAVGRS